jgi:hypothetical protein
VNSGAVLDADHIPCHVAHLAHGLIVFLWEHHGPFFLCDLSVVVKLPCSDTHVNELIFITGELIGVIPFLFIIMSSTRIFSSILKVLYIQGIHRCSLPVAPTCLLCHCSMGQS